VLENSVPASLRKKKERPGGTPLGVVQRREAIKFSEIG